MILNMRSRVTYLTFRNAECLVQFRCRGWCLFNRDRFLFKLNTVVTKFIEVDLLDLLELLGRWIL